MKCISGIFGRKNMLFENRAPSHLRYCHFASVCQISWKNIKYSSRNSWNNSGENRLFRRFLESSNYKNQFYWQMKYALKWWALILIMFLCEKTMKYKEKVRWKSAKKAISGIFPAFLAGKEFFSKIGLNHILSIANVHLYWKNQKKLMKKSRENAKKPVFPAYFRYFRPEMNFFRKSGSVTF